MLNVANVPDCSAVLIAGPTASGKSQLAQEIAKAKNGIIINADSMQVYSRWRILTARPTRLEENQLPHALYGHVDHNIHYSVGNWLKDVSTVISNNNGKLPIIIGGTGLYFKALTEGLAEIPSINPDVRREAQLLLKTKNVMEIADQLQQLDPTTFARIDQKNPARLVRAWEVIKSTGRGLKAWQDVTPPPLLPTSKVYPILLNTDKEVNSTRINARLNKMVISGALEECALALQNWNPDLPSSKAIGAVEFIDYIRGQVSFTVSMERVHIATRQYAKRQRAWFRSNMRKWNHITVGR